MAVEQGTATFYCQHLSCDDINWRVNGKSPNRIKSPNITASNTGTMFILLIGTVLEFNGASITCLATIGSIQMSTSPVTLLIQGV